MDCKTIALEVGIASQYLLPDSTREQTAFVMQNQVHTKSKQMLCRVAISTTTSAMVLHRIRREAADQLFGG